MGFGDADDERFGGGWGAFEERADPAAGADVAEERVWGVAVGVEGGERAFQECRLDGVSGHLEKRIGEDSPCETRLRQSRRASASE